MLPAAAASLPRRRARLPLALLVGSARTPPTNSQCSGDPARRSAPQLLQLCHPHHQAPPYPWPSQVAAFSSVDGKIGADPDEVAELIEANIRRPSRQEQRDAAQSPTRLLTTRREALALYREILRYSNLFVWKDEHGRVWRDVIRASARAEYEQARHEPDPELINRMIVTGRDAVQRTVEGFARKRQRIIADEDARPQGAPPPLQ